MRPNECFAYFALRGFTASPDEISAALGLQPSKAWRAGDAHDAHRIVGKKRDASFWCIESRIARGSGASFEDHVQDVLEQLRPRFDAAVELSTKHSGLIELVGYFHQHYPGLCLSGATLQRIAALSAELDCDFYYLAADEPEANQSLEPTTLLGTSAAEQPLVPSRVVAHL